MKARHSLTGAGVAFLLLVLLVAAGWAAQSAGWWK